LGGRGEKDLEEIGESETKEKSFPRHMKKRAGGRSRKKKKGRRFAKEGEMSSKYGKRKIGPGENKGVARSVSRGGGEFVTNKGERGEIARKKEEF